MGHWTPTGIEPMDYDDAYAFISYFYPIAPNILVFPPNIFDKFTPLLGSLHRI